jgi:hypothetical protein
MSSGPLRWIAALLGVALVAGLVTLLISNEDGGDGETTRTALRPNESLGLTEETNESPPAAAAEQEVKRTAKSYVAALNEDGGGHVCRLFVPGAIDDLDLPRVRDDCPTSLTASIGYRDPRGLPVFKDSRITSIEGVEVNDTDARVTATILTRFADRDEPSVEDDVIYLTRVGDKWLIAKPSAAIYRAIGAEPPPRAISPP